MRSNAKTQSLSAFVSLAALALLTAPAAMAATTAPAPTCLALEDKCLAHVHRQQSKSNTAASDGVERPHLTENECYDSYHKAQTSGVWPAHLPFNFALSCTN